MLKVMDIDAPTFPGQYVLHEGAKGFPPVHVGKGVLSTAEQRTAVACACCEPRSGSCNTAHPCA